ncbi:MAG: prepilin-type N-terminal cleavage/methylation domain-containing protein [PVC group bacterium]|nr:prepilin-type N-terminal cleavage/methylation domain-containing protein [PVC group bacterium]
MNKGFTLLEMLIGITIFAMVAAAVYTSLALGIKVVKHEENQDKLMQEAVLTLQEMSRSLRCAFINSEDTETIRFTGIVDRLDFFSINKEGDLENVVFYVEAGTGEDPWLLYRSRKKYLDIEDEDAGRVELIHSRVGEFKLSYFDAAEETWYEEWPEEFILPNQVKLEIDFIPKDKDQNIELVKYMQIPMANVLEFPVEESDIE